MNELELRPRRRAADVVRRKAVEEALQPAGVLGIAARLGNVPRDEARVADHVHVRASSKRRANAKRLELRRMLGRSRPVRRDVRKRGQRRVAVHRRDATVEPKSIRFRGEATLLEHRVERAVLREELRAALRADAARSGDLVRWVAAERDEVRHLSRIDAVALTDLGRADARRTPFAGWRTVTRSVTSWNASRSEVATSAVPPAASSCAAAAARKSSAS